MNLKKLKGFTLLELIVVIAIIAVMAMVLVPAIGDNVKFSKMRAANDQTHEIYLAAQDVLVNLQLQGTETISTGICYLSLYNPGNGWRGTFGTTGTSIFATAADSQSFTDSFVKNLCDRMGGDFNGNSESGSACVIAFYPKTFTVKHVVYSNYGDTYNVNQNNCWAIGGNDTASENLYISFLGSTGHTQEYDYKHSGASNSHPYVGQFPIN